jgi:hypothetical protein
MLEYAASLLPFTGALAAPKLGRRETPSTPQHKRMTSKDLVRKQNGTGAKRKGKAPKSEVQNNAYSVHAATEHAEMAATRAIPVLCSRSGEGAWGADFPREKGQALGPAEDPAALNLACLLRGYTKPCGCTGKVPRPRGTKTSHYAKLFLGTPLSGTTP